MIRLYVIGGLMLALASAAGVQTLRLHWAQAAMADMRADAATAAAQRADARTVAEQDARDIESDLVARAASVATAYQRGLNDAQAAADVIADELRAGKRRLRAQWRGCQADRLSATAAATAGADAAEQGRRDSAARIVRAADTCDAQVSALQALVRADRAALEPGP